MILAIETATEICSVAMVHQSAVLCSRSVNEKNIHSERLLSLIDEVIAGSSVAKSDIESVAVSIGPGSFTGLRIGLSTAKGLALAWDLPIIAVPTLDGIAESFRREQNDGIPRSFCAMVDAKRDEAFYASYSVTNNEIQKEYEYHIKNKHDIVNESNARNCTVQQPAISAVSIGLLAERRRKEFIVSDFSHLEPLYLREFVATLPRK